jgi:hypothetical protein
VAHFKPYLPLIIFALLFGLYEYEVYANSIDVKIARYLQHTGLFERQPPITYADNTTFSGNAPIGAGNTNSHSSTIINVDDVNSVYNYLTSRTFKNIDGNMTIKFYPEGYYELSHDYEVALAGKWEIGEIVYQTGFMLHLGSTRGDHLNLILSSDGKITDTDSHRVFQ